MATVAGPRTAQGDRQRENLESDAEQDACTLVDESPGGLSLTDPRVEAVDAELVSREKQSRAGETALTDGDHELKVVFKGGDRLLTKDLSPEKRGRS